jgi:hypothetical protein
MICFEYQISLRLSDTYYLYDVLFLLNEGLADCAKTFPAPFAKIGILVGLGKASVACVGSERSLRG